MEIIHANYLISSPAVEKCPAPALPEYAFIGRSNVGKSSLINMLTNKKELAKVSSSPGKTQLINHFEIVDSSRNKWYLVDLPGYGYAKRSQSMRKEWKKMIERYMRERQNLVTLFVLIDSRIEPQAIDLEFVNQLGQWQASFALVFTKTDKVTQREVARNVNAFLAELAKTWEEPPLFFLTSAIKRTGARQILAYIAEANEDYVSRKS